jgi:hypothetical protein
MSQIFLAALILLLSHGLPLLGVQWNDTAITSFAQSLLDIGCALWIAIRRHQQGDITVAGIRK